MKKALVTGSAGLIGSEAVRFLVTQGFQVIGIDNDMRKYFFGDEASTDWNRKLLEQEYSDYKHFSTDIRGKSALDEIFDQHKFDLIIHTAAQPSHDWAAKEPLTDFSVNALGTLNLLESFRNYCPEAVFIFTSTNKVYGDTPNELPLVEHETRFEISPDHKYANGIDETMSIDFSKHSIFGASKVAADIMVQEYGRYFGLNTVCFRGGCLTGPSHSGTKLHGFLAYLIKCIAESNPYTILGYKGKQVRDNIHSEDLISAFWEFYQNPRQGEVYNIGGSRHSNVSMMEAIEKIEQAFGRKGNIDYSEQNRIGDHIWYVSDVSKFQKHYPKWQYKYNIDDIIEEICTFGHFSIPQVSSVVVSEMESTFRQKIFVASHVTEGFGVVQALKAYLVKRNPRFAFVEHPFSYSGISGSRVSTFRSSLPSTEEAKKQTRNVFLSFIRDFVLSIYWCFKRGKDSTVFVGVDSLNALAGLVLKRLGLNFELVYYAPDYTPNRFDNKLLNKIYQTIDRVVSKGADYVWNISERMQQMRADFVEESRNLYVPNGVYLDKVNLEARKGRDINSLVISEHLTKGKGLELVLDCFEDILKLNANATLSILGTGPDERYFKSLVAEKRLQDKIFFLGNETPDIYLNYLAKFGIGLCFREGGVESLAYYSDPTSVKEFLSCGVPVIVTSNLWVSVEVASVPLGKAIALTKSDLLDALGNLWQDSDLYGKASRNGPAFSNKFSWEKIYLRAFAHLKNYDQ